LISPSSAVPPSRPVCKLGPRRCRLRRPGSPPSRSLGRGQGPAAPLPRCHSKYQFYPIEMGASPTSPGGEPLVISGYGYPAGRMVEKSGDES
jgi:hypothetical protein